MKRIFLTVIILIFADFFYAHSQEEAGEIFDRANKLYMNEKFQESVDEYTKILNIGYKSGAIYYNLGNVYYKLGNIGKTILFYEKANKIISGDEDLDNNLKLAKLFIADKITTIPEIFYIRYFRKFASIFGTSGWIKIFLTLYIILNLIICGRIIIKNRKIRIILNRIIFLSSIVTAFVLFVLIYSNYQLNRVDGAIIMSEKVNVSSSPIEGSTELFSIHEGTKVKIKRAQGKWIEISLPDGKVGWITKNHIEII